MAYKPNRIAAPSVIADAASTLHAWVECSLRIAPADRDRWHNAIMKAHAQLHDGARVDRVGDDFIFPSRSRTGIAHHVNGVCDCEAASEQQPCWHRAAKRLVLLISESEHAAFVSPPLAAAQPASTPTCGCGASMHQLAGRWACTACQYTRPSTPATPPAAAQATPPGPPATVRHPVAYRCPSCGSRMPPAVTPGGEACYECSNPRCGRVIAQAAL